MVGILTLSLFSLASAGVGPAKGGAASLGSDSKKDDGSFLAVEFALVDDELGQHDGASWCCINMVLRPEEGTEYQRFAEVEHRPILPDSSADLKAAEAACYEKGGIYTSVESLRAFINDATSTSKPETCDATAGKCGADAGEEDLSSPLAQAIKGWNDRFFNMDAAATRESSVLFHGRGSEPRHLAQQVSHFVMPRDVQKRITERLATYRELIFGNEGAGQGGTTGAHFLSGNVGFGNNNQGGNLMDLIFPKASGKNSSSYCSAKSVKHEGEAYARGQGYNMMGEWQLDNACGDADGDGHIEKAPDMEAYEEALLKLFLSRSDAKYFLGDEVDVQWQHRLWRFGPNFDPKTKGGIWHKDTCPFGINGALPEGSLMFTTVYILYTENLNGPTAGTRVRDSDGTIFSLPCIAGEGNTIRSGESDTNIFFHSGPLNIKKMDPSKPAYRVMMQTKALIRHKHWKNQHRTIPSKGSWRGLKINPVGQPAGDAPKEALALKQWLRHASQILTTGVAESNAVGFEAYPVGVFRAWEVTRDLGNKLGFRLSGLLPEPEVAATPVILFGFDIRHAEPLINLLNNNQFRVTTVASDTDWDPLRAAKQDSYSNMNTADIMDPKKVRHILTNNPFDIHVIVDVPPVGPRSLGEPLLKKYYDVFAEVAAFGRGEGRMATVTLLSQQMPTGGRDSAGKATGGDVPLSDVQKGFLEAEKNWVAFGEKHGVRVVVMRVADRVVTPLDSAMRIVKGKQEASTHQPCRVEVCDSEQALTRVNSEDLHNVLLRMLSMFDIVDTHGSDSSMHGSASFDSSISRFPSGTVLEVVDDGPPDSMEEAKLWASIMMGDEPVCGSAACEGRKQSVAKGHRAAKDRNADLKKALGMPKLKYPSYKYAGAKFFGAGEM